MGWGGGEDKDLIGFQKEEGGGGGLGKHQRKFCKMFAEEKCLCKRISQVIKKMGM